MSATVSSDQWAVDRPMLAAPVLVCSVRECGRPARVGFAMCQDCIDTDRAYERYWSKAATRLRDFGYVVLFVAMMSAIGYYVWPYIWAPCDLWFGGRQ
jgi:hypothetical protein